MKDFISKLYILILFIILIKAKKNRKSLSERVEKLSKEDIMKIFEIDEGKYTPKELKKKAFTSALGMEYDACEKAKDYTIPQLFIGFPVLRGKVFKVGDTVEFPGYCFKHNTLTVKSMDTHTVELLLTANEAKSLLCQDHYLFHISSKLHYQIAFFEGEQEISISLDSTHATPEEMIDEINFQGLRIFSLCEGLSDSIKSMIKSIEFIMYSYEKREKKDFKSLYRHKNNKEPTYEEMEKECVNFLKTYSKVNITQRYGFEEGYLPVEEYIHSGDFLGQISIPNGESAFISYFNGGAISHSSMALRVGGKLHIVEVNDDGLLMTPWEEALKEADRTVHTIVWMPLSEKYRERFDEIKAYDFVRKRLGTPYGMKTFVVAAADTVENLMPDQFNSEHVMLVAHILYLIDQKEAQDDIVASVGFRLGNENMTFFEAVKNCVKLKISFEEILTIPEDDSFMYSDGENLICSSLVVAIYKYAGLFGDLKINAKEFTPRDLYQLKIFDENFINTRPSICKEADPGLNWCYIMGKYRIHFNEYNTVEPYAHMNEKCPYTNPIIPRKEFC